MVTKIFIISFWTFGFCCTFWEGMIFEKIDKYLEQRWPEWLRKPLYACYICACFWWGSAIYWIFLGNSWTEWFLTVIPAMGLNAALSKLFSPELKIKQEEQ